jgi:hypothetical protein
MFAFTSEAAEGGGWRRSPLVAALALLGILLAVARFTCRSREGTAPEDLPEAVREEGKQIPRHCAVCQKVFLLSRAELESLPGDEPLIVKARKAPCPTCGNTGSGDALRCLHCAHYFSPVGPESKGGTVCPNCQKNPFGD